MARPKNHKKLEEYLTSRLNQMLAPYAEMVRRREQQAKATKRANG